ncbi:hypothetical protein KKB71_00610 [Patescibacteria group bacterium]|nr:hypothetical protein [Patescibacteria group bacterium]MBU2219100.1 hypothetical protein [Patescibacteria group bacterium]
MKKKIKISNGVKPKYIIGIDEVGRGPLAGPVTVTALAVPANYKLQNPNYKLRDSTPPRPCQSSAISLLFTNYGMNSCRIFPKIHVIR